MAFQKPESESFELDVAQDVAGRLLTPAGPVTNWNVDVADNDPVVTEGVLAAAKASPPPSPPLPSTSPSSRPR